MTTETPTPKKTLLEQVQTGRIPAPRRILLYGVHGVGKSTWAAGSEKSIFVQTEDGLGQVECNKFPLVRNYAQVMQALGELDAGEHEYRTAVVDSLDWLEKIIWARVCQKVSVESIEDIGYAKGYVFALTQWREVLNALSVLRDKHGMTVILIAHARIEKFDNPEMDSYHRYAPDLNKHASALVQEWCDEVLFATYKVYTRKIDKGFGKFEVKGVGGGERVVYTSERPAHLAKSRLDLPFELPLKYEAYAEYVLKQVKGS